MPPFSMGLPSQVGSCWDDPGAEFEGHFSTYVAADGQRLTERFGRTLDGRVVQTLLDGIELCLHSGGPVTWSADGRSIEAVGEGGWVLLATRGDGRTMELAVTPGRDGPAYRWTVDGQLRSFGADGAAWRDALLPIVSAFWEASQRADRVGSLAGLLALERERLRTRGGGAELAELVEARRQELQATRVALEARRREAEVVAARADTLRAPLEDSVRAAMDRRFQAEVEAVRSSLERLQAATDTAAAEVAERERQRRAALEQYEIGRQFMRTMIDRPTSVSEMIPLLRAWEQELAAAERAIAQVQAVPGSPLARLREAIAGVP